MRAEDHGSGGKAGSFLGRLIRDRRANTLAMMTMALIPLAGMMGGAMDISRMYIVKTRLQHACDAGALAGRKAMSSGTWAFGNYAARTAAEKFFEANYNSAAFGATAVTKSFTENAGKVSGTASATLPMTLMRIFGRTTETLTVICDAEMRLPNTDIMFVLDTTGSMDETPSGDNKAKIAGLRIAVKCFYEIVARLDTDATCVNGAPSGGTGNQVQIRFGFMPYSVNVNVGKLLPTSYFADTWNYQTRRANGSTNSTTTYPNTVDSTGPSGAISDPWTGYSDYGSANLAGRCVNPGPGTVGPTTTSVNSNPTIDGNGNRVWTTTTTVSIVESEYRIISVLGIFCQTQRRTRTTGTYTTVVHTSAPVTTTSLSFQNWTYAQLPVNVGLLKNGTEWRDSFLWPTGPSGADKPINWDGCIEERKTTAPTTNFDPIPADALDLDIDLVPSADPNSKWGPALPGLIYTRNGYGNSTSNWTQASSQTTNDYGNGSNYTCPSQAKRLQTWPDATEFNNYVNGLATGGNTYHDIGLLWGARFASPNGIFKEDNDFTPKGGEIERHIIFMTDGDTNTSSNNYNAYGIPWFDRRQTAAGSVPTTAQLDQQVDLRFAALCRRIKNTTFNGRQAYTLWVISFGSVSTDTADRLRNCATSGRYFSAADSTALQNTFKSIADQISQLRLTK